MAFAVKANPNRFVFQQVVSLLVLTMLCALEGCRINSFIWSQIANKEKPDECLSAGELSLLHHHCCDAEKWGQRTASACFSTKDLYERSLQLLAYYESLYELIGKLLGLSFQACCLYKSKEKKPQWRPEWLILAFPKPHVTLLIRVNTSVIMWTHGCWKKGKKILL